MSFEQMLLSVHTRHDSRPAAELVTRALPAKVSPNSMMHTLRVTSLLLAFAGACAAQTLQPPFAGTYSFVDLGTPPGVPANLGGVAFSIADQDAIYICGDANQAPGALYRIAVTRDANGHVTGFSGTATQVSTAGNNDGGLQFGPGGVIFFTRYSMNEVGQIKPGSTVPDKIVQLTPLGVPTSVGALSFVPAGYPNQGQLKIASYNAGRFGTLSVQADGNGTFDLVNLRLGTTPGYGPEGILYPPPGSPLLTDFSHMLVAEYGAGVIAVYDIDANADPIPSTRRLFITGLTGAEGAASDPRTGDFFFSTYGGSNRVIAVRGFGLPCGQVARYGQGLAGSGGHVPLLSTAGCFARNQRADFLISQGLGGAPGLLAAGIQQTSLPLFGGTLLVVPFITISHGLGGVLNQPGAGTFSLPMDLPNNTHLLNTDFFFQALYFDVGAAQQFSLTGGVRLNVR